MLPPREFLKSIKPFEDLKDCELEYLVKNLKVNAYEEGEIILRRGKKIKNVYIVFSGSIGIYEESDLVDIAKSGDIIGADSEEANYNAVAREDVICYEIPKRVFKELMEKNEKFQRFFESLKKGDFASIRKEIVILERFLYKPIRELLIKAPIVCSATTSIRDAVIKMELNKVGSIVIVDEKMKPIGIFTNADLRRFIVYKGSPEERVSAYMSKPAICVDLSKPIFEAYMEFIKRGVNHLVVLEGEKVTGVITPKDVLSHFEPTSSIVIQTRRLIKANSIKELNAIYKNIIKTIAILTMRGLQFYELTSLISEVYDTLSVKVIELLKKDFENKMGKLPDFLWVVMGSSGRREQVIATDQDNAIIHEGDGEGILEFAKMVNDALEKVGIPKCSGNYMASNPLWARDVEDWKSLFREWLQTLKPGSIRHLTVFLDMRPIFGKLKLYDEVCEEILNSKTRMVIRELAEDSVMFKPPHGIFGIKGRIDLKKFGIYPITNGVRALALDKDLVKVTNTRERIEKLRESNVISDKTANGLISGYEFLQELRLRLHVQEVLKDGIGNKNNEIEVDKLDRLETILLKETFKVISEFQKLLKMRYSYI
ncbi:MAG: DUF294 nucleotidyltransferase-like domain-containing protein [Archaeoglobales archaeon]|nr:DUF294 nucleotidyltransferase-like domain-containing protein [Archaeoglobales archaeon]